MGAVGMKMDQKLLNDLLLLLVLILWGIWQSLLSVFQGMIGLIVFDTLGILLRWQLFDHAAHLGGMLFGM